MQSVFRESSAEKTTINAGGVQDVRETGSKAVDTIINSNGVQEIHDGGEALTTHIYGGAQYIDGGIADDTYIHSGTQNIDRGGKATNTYIYNGKQIVRERDGNKYNNSPGRRTRDIWYCKYRLAP